MKISIIHGQNHKGSTYHIARMLAEKVGGEITEFFVPRDFGEFCVGCNNCFMKGEELCPHYEQRLPITNALIESDLIILASPVYVYHCSGPMKTLLDHYAYQWMVHRPNEKMFKKQAVCISTAAGSGTRSTNKDMADSLFFWGVPKIYRYGKGVAAVNWNGVEEKKKQKIGKEISQLADKIKRHDGKVHVGIKTKAFFKLMSLIQRNGWCEIDMKYWKDRGWTGKARPWK